MKNISKLFSTVLSAGLSLFTVDENWGFIDQRNRRVWDSK